MENSLLTRSQYETALYEGRLKGLEEGMEKGMEKGIAEGTEKGRLDEKRKIILSSFKKGLPLELIAEIVSISVEEVEQILNEA